MYDKFLPKFTKRYRLMGQEMFDTFSEYRDEVRSGRFPDADHSYSVSDEVLDTIVNEFGPI